MERNVLTIPRGTALAAAARMLADRDIGGAPVCNPDGSVLGIVTKTDLIEAFGAEVLVEDVMYPEVFSLHEDDAVERAIRTMAFEGVHRLVVFGDDGRLSGIVTSMDVMRWLAGLPRSGERNIGVAPPERDPG
jgi:predicted transcriptional regulator